MQRPLGAQISHMLKDRGVDVIFGIPGVHNQEMYRGIEEAGITHVLARHEQGAGFMADGYARATGRPGVAYVITGPGLCNIMTPMGQAYSDSVPVLVISSCLDETAATKGQLHQMKDQRGAAAAVCDWSEEARTAEAAYGLIDRALSEFQRQRAKPKHIQVPVPLLEASACRAEKNFAAIVDPRLPADYWTVAFSAIKAAQKPLFVFGGGASHSQQIARGVVERLGAASFTTYAGRGIIGSDDLLHFGAFLSRFGSAGVFSAADLVVLIGTQASEVDLWRDQFGHSCGAVHVDLDVAELVRGQSQDIRVLADALTWLEELYSWLGDEHQPAMGWTPEEVAAFRTKARAEVDAERPGIVPVCDALRDCLPEGTMIYSDMTQFAYAAKEVWDMDRPGHWHHPTGFGTLGYALPAAIGGAVGRRGLPTMAIAGDYGFQYTVQELGTAVELGLPLPIILWDNGKLGEIEDSMRAAQIAPNAVIAHNPDFCKLAEAYGALSAEPKSLSELQAVARDAFQAKVPTLIRVTPEIARS